MSWKDFIHSYPDILTGKPVVKGTRISVEFLLGLFAQGWSETEILENYPSLNAKSIHAALAFTTEREK